MDKEDRMQLSLYMVFTFVVLLFIFWLFQKQLGLCFRCDSVWLYLEILTKSLLTSIIVGPVLYLGQKSGFYKWIRNYKEYAITFIIVLFTFPIYTYVEADYHRSPPITYLEPGYFHEWILETLDISNRFTILQEYYVFFLFSIPIWLLIVGIKKISRKYVPPKISDAILYLIIIIAILIIYHIICNVFTLTGPFSVKIVE